LPKGRGLMTTDWTWKTPKNLQMPIYGKSSLF
jgi:hypothetical protein